MYSGILFSFNENEMMKIAGKWMELEVILSEVIQFQKGKSCHMLFLMQTSFPSLDVCFNQKCGSQESRKSWDFKGKRVEHKWYKERYNEAENANWGEGQEGGQGITNCKVL